MIDEKKLIEDIKKYFKDLLFGCIIDNNTMWLSKEVRNIIESQPQIEKCADCSRRKFYQQGYEDGKNANKWIPCSEKLPDIDMSYPNEKDYLVYYEHGCYDVASYSNINRFWHEYTTEPYWNGAQYCKVIAWQPLPEPYKG